MPEYACEFLENGDALFCVNTNMEEFIWLSCMKYENVNLIAIHTLAHTRTYILQFVCTVSIVNLPFRILMEFIGLQFANKQITQQACPPSIRII